MLLPVPNALRTEHAVTPLAVDDTAPTFSWHLPDGSTAGTYRLRVVVSPWVADELDPSDENVPAVWDEILSSYPEPAAAPPISVRYQGLPLQPSHRYSWAVGRLTGQGGVAWSNAATFETGLLGGAASGAFGNQWISDDVSESDFVDFDQAGPELEINRIWLPQAPLPPEGPPPQPRAGSASFCRVFAVPAGRPVQWAKLAVGSDIAIADIRLNGRPVSPGSVDSSFVRPGENVLTLSAESHEQAHTGLLLRLDVGLWAAPTLTVASDGQWQVRDDVAAPWVLAMSFGPHGIAPFGRDRASQRPSPYLRREFFIEGKISTARLRCTAVGVYRASVNGQPVSPDVLAPGWVDLDKRLPYQIYDVTEKLRPGVNVWGVQLGDGWSLGNVCWFGRNQYAQQRAYTAELEIRYRDGRMVLVGTDEGWLMADSDLRYSDLQNGCDIDAASTRPNWDHPAGLSHRPEDWRDASSVLARTGPLQAQIAPPIRVQSHVEPVEISQRANGNYVIDFGQNLVGWVQLKLNAEAGHRVLLSHAEVLDADGELYVAGLRSARATDSYRACGATSGEVFEPQFTVHGFRYCEVSGHPGELKPEDVRAVVVHAHMQPTGHFSCSDERLNQLQRNIVWSQRGNFLTVPTDCPQRDERLGWTGDAQVFGATAAFNYDVQTFLRKYLLDVRDAIGADGAIPHVAPDVLSVQMGRAEAGAAGWGDVIVMLPHVLWLAYGDDRVLHENIEAIAGWLDYCRIHSDELIRPAAGFGDWLGLENTPVDLVSTAFFAQAARLAAEIGDQLGDARSPSWHTLASDVREAFRRRYVRGGGELTSASQSGYLLALAFGLFDEHERSTAAQRLVRAIAGKNWHLSTGFLGTPYLLPVLRDEGELDVADRLLLTETFPSWLYPIVAGDATTIWERWDSWSDSRGFQDPAMTSFNHYAYGAVGDWIYRTVGGLNPVEPGYRRSRIAVLPGGGLQWASTSLLTPFGTLSSDWRVAGDQVELEVFVPTGTTAEVVEPSGPTHEVGPGRHRFHWPLTRRSPGVPQT